MIFVTKPDGSRWLDIDSLDVNMLQKDTYLITGDRSIKAHELFLLLDKEFEEITEGKPQ
jgi:hypothetical protein